MQRLRRDVRAAGAAFLTDRKYIGTISHGLKSDSGSQYKLNIAAIPSSPNSNLKTYITLGLSKHDLNYKSRFEILFVCSLKYDENQIFPF